MNASPPMGWYPDPTQANQERYWDGQNWTHNVRDPQPDQRWQAGLGQASTSVQPGTPGGGWQGYRHPHGGQPSAPWPQTAQTAPSQPTTADGVALASFWWRVGARLVDSLTAQLVAVPIIWPWWRQIYQETQRVMAEVLAGQVYDQQAFYDTLQRPALLAGLVQIAVFLVLTAVGQGLFGRTVGKALFGLRLVPTDQGRQRLPGWRIAGVRQLVVAAFNLADQFVSITSLINVLVYFSGSKRQTLADRIAGSQVVRDRSGRSA